MVRIFADLVTQLLIYESRHFPATLKWPNKLRPNAQSITVTKALPYHLTILFTALPVSRHTLAPWILGFLIMRVPKSDAQRNICLVSGIYFIAAERSETAIYSWRYMTFLLFRAQSPTELYWANSIESMSVRRMPRCLFLRPEQAY
jgi:hypothetical protein